MKIFTDYTKKQLSKNENDKEVLIDAFIEMKPLNVLDYQRILGLIGEGYSKEGDSEGAIEIRKMADPRIAELIKEILPKYCKNLIGFEVVEKGSTREATIEDFVSFAAFFNFSFKVLIDLFSLSSISDKEEDSLKK